MRFRKRVKVFPGFYLNFSGSGISSTFGVPGASINIGKKGTYLNTGFPGTGFYDRKRIGGPTNSNMPANTFMPEQTDPRELYNLHSGNAGEIKSADAQELTSASLAEMKETLNEVFNDRIELGAEIYKTKKEISSAKRKYFFARVIIIGFMMKSFKLKIIERQEYLADLEEQLKNSIVDIDIHFDESFKEKYSDLAKSFGMLLQSQVVWDITSSYEQNRVATRSSATYVVTRVPVRFDSSNINIIKSSYAAFHFENKNGGDMYIYPGFVIVTSRNNEFGLIDIKDLDIRFNSQQFVEAQSIPSDTYIVDTTWAKCNKDGSPDRRFTGNYQIPVVRYGQINLNTNTGLNESYHISNHDSAERFVECFLEYQISILAK